MKPPIAPQRPHVHTEHGHERPDPWYWLRHREDPEVIRYLEEENRFTDASLAHLEGLRKTLFEEMRGRIQETDMSAPVPWGGFWYYRRTVEGLSYPIYCRRRGTMEAPEEVLLDVNELAEGHEYTSLGAFEVSPDHSVLAYAVDHTGREIYDVRFKDLETGEHLSDTLLGIWPDLVWADARTLLYTTLDETLRPWRLHRHVLGGRQADDPVVYEEADERFRVSAYRTRSGAFVVMIVRSSLTTECHVLPTDRPDQPFRCLQPRHAGMRYSVDHQGDRFLILTNDADDEQGRHTDAAIGFKLMQAPLSSSSRADWVEVVPHRPGVTLERVDAFKGHAVLFERADGLARLRVLVPEGEAFGSAWRDDDHLVALPDPAYELDLEQNPTYETRELRFAYSSLARPRTIYAYDVQTRQRTLLKQDPVLGDFDPERYVVERLHATAADGTKVPISLVRRKEDVDKGPGPVLLYGYGSYGITVDPGFSSIRLSLVDRGVAFAIAHIRGGGALGRPWHEVAKFKGKMHTFNDFVACAEHLIDNGLTRPDQLAIMGGSAGGMLMGAVINMRPELFRCCVAQVPFVDVVTTMLDESLPLTANEWEEWGDPRDPEMFRYMLQYSPYDNVVDQRYPDLLVTSGLNDPRVQYWEPTKWVAALRAKVSEPNRSLVLLRTNMGAGHQGRSGRYGYLEERAFDYAFVLDRLGLAGSAA